VQKILDKYSISSPYFLLAVLLPIVGVYGSYNAARIAEESSQTHFHFFWLSMLVPIAIISMFALKNNDSYRLWIGISGLAYITTLPKIFRASEGPIFHDEYAHYKTTEDFLINGEAYFYNSVVNPAPMFSNMHSLVANISNFLGLDIWAAAASLTIIIHLAGLFIVASIMKQLKFSNTGVFLGTFIYAVNPNWMFFHSQFAYESFGIIFAIIGISIFIKVRSLSNDLYVVLGGLFLGVYGYWLAGLHHLSSIGYIFILSIILLSHIVYHVKTKSQDMKNVALLFSASLAGVGLRLLQDWEFISEYLFTPVQNASQQISSLFSALLGSDNTPTRIPFAGGSLPFYEIAASYLTVTIYGLLFMAFLASFIPKVKNKFNIEHKTITSEIAAFMFVSSLYFVSVVFILTVSGAEGARRSWGYIFLGLGVLAAWTWDNYLIKHPRAILGFMSSDFRKIVASLIMPVMFLGGVSTGVNASYRFPVNTEVSSISDLTASSYESKALGEWFKNNTDEESWVIADRYTKLSLVANGRVQVPTAYVNFPYWNLYLGSGNKAELESLLTSMYTVGVKYVVVDSRMEYSNPELDFWFARTEPAEQYNSSIIDKLSDAGVLVKKAIVETFTVYQFELPKEYASKIDSYNLKSRMELNNAKDLINFIEEVKGLNIEVEGILKDE
jgi:hypothetical protein